MEWIVIIIVLYLISVFLFSSSKHKEQDSTEEIEILSIADYDKLFTPSFSRNTPIVPKNLDFTLPTKTAGNQFMSAQDKAAYLDSVYWKNLKQDRMTLANGMCEVKGCTNTTHLNLHHVNYIRLGCELITDVRIVCNKDNNGCHSKIHIITGYDRKDLHPIEVITKELT